MDATELGLTFRMLSVDSTIDALWLDFNPSIQRESSAITPKSVE
jgi:hypothetical protein